MAYDHNNLSVVAETNGFTMWHYKTTDKMEEVDTVGYFKGIRDMRIGDIIVANVGHQGAGIYLVINVRDVVIVKDLINPMIPCGPM